MYSNIHHRIYLTVCTLTFTIGSIWLYVPWPTWTSPPSYTLHSRAWTRTGQPVSGPTSPALSPRWAPACYWLEAGGCLGIFTIRFMIQKSATVTVLSHFTLKWQSITSNNYQIYKTRILTCSSCGHCWPQPVVTLQDISGLGPGNSCNQNIFIIIIVIFLSSKVVDLVAESVCLYFDRLNSISKSINLNS